MLVHLATRLDRLGFSGYRVQTQSSLLGADAGMSKALSVDLRDRVIVAIEGGMSCR